MGTDPFKKSWWFLEAHDGSWLADRDHELLTGDPNKALKWPNFTDADRARRALHQPLWHRIRAPTEHVFVDLEAPTPPPVSAVTREELAEMANDMLDAGPGISLNANPWPAGPGECAAWGRGCNSGWDAAVIRFRNAILSRLAAGQAPETET